MELTHEESIEQDRCYWCKRKGGRVQLDQYALEINDKEIEVRLHEACASELAQEI